MSLEMSAPVATVTVTNLSTITAKIHAIKDTVGKVLAMAHIEIGGLLTQAKEQVPPGEWTYYIENEVEMSHRSVNNCMKLYAEYIKNPDSQALASMPYTKAVRLLSLPEEDRAEFVENHDVEEMSTRELDQAIKERNAARLAQETAEAKSRDLEQSLLDAQQKLANAKNIEAAWQEQIDKLTADRDKAVAAEEKAKQKIQTLKDNPTVPASILEKLANEAADNAASAFQEKLYAAQKELQAANDAKIAAEKQAEDARQKLAEVQNAARVSSPEAAAFSVLYPQLEETFNKLNGCRMKVAVNDPELGKKLKKLMQDKIDAFQKAVE